ncbi:polysaccharide deacetylase family protein [Candidatus Kaiserbacteria bacterium]|nr:polysaccharide deacetylase family protein [Candidatus Kaiserbacteria bacterium]
MFRNRLALALALCSLPTLAPAGSGYTAAGAPCVALTFDDGPQRTLTPELLALLNARGIHATFYLVGNRVAQWPDVVRAEIADGDEVGNHSYDHKLVTRLSREAAEAEYVRTDAAIEAALGTDAPPATLRAPYGAVRRTTKTEFAPRPFIAWTIDTLDWKYPDSARIARIVIEKSRPGAIVLMHDIHAKTITAVPAIIVGLERRGFVFVTVSELINNCIYAAP